MQTILDSIDKSQNQLDKNSIVGEIPLLNAYITKESAPCGALSSFLISDIVYRITLLLRSRLSFTINALAPDVAFMSQESNNY